MNDTEDHCFKPYGDLFYTSKSLPNIYNYSNHRMDTLHRLGSAIEFNHKCDCAMGPVGGFFNWRSASIEWINGQVGSSTIHWIHRSTPKKHLQDWICTHLLNLNMFCMDKPALMLLIFEAHHSFM